MNPPLISFVIPVFSCATNLLGMIKSIVAECSKDSVSYEIIVIDSIFSEDTSEIVKEYQSENFKYIKFNIKTTFDFNLNYGIKLAAGKYIWPLSGDDLLKKNALNKILEGLTKYSDTDIILLNSTNSSKSMGPYNRYYFGSLINKKILDFKIYDKQSLYDFINSNKNSESLFSFMSCIIFKSNILMGKLNELANLDGSFWRFHGQLLNSLAEFNKEILVLNEFCIRKRRGCYPFKTQKQSYRIVIVTVNIVEALKSTSFDYKTKKILINRALSPIKYWHMLFSALTINNLEDLNFFRQSYMVVDEFSGINRRIQVRSATANGGLV